MREQIQNYIVSSVPSWCENKQKLNNKWVHRPIIIINTWMYSTIVVYNFIRVDFIWFVCCTRFQMNEKTRVVWIMYSLLNLQPIILDYSQQSDLQKYKQNQKTCRVRVLLCNTNIDYRIFDQKPIHFKPVIELEKKITWKREHCSIASHRIVIRISKRKRWEWWIWWFYDWISYTVSLS